MDYINTNAHLEIKLALANKEIESLRAQLPEEMQDCTIYFKECEFGHGTLTATNWVQHECFVCTINALKAQLSAMQIMQGNDPLCLIPPSAKVLVEALRGMVDAYEYEASSGNPALINAKKVLAAYESKLLQK